MAAARARASSAVRLAIRVSSGRHTVRRRGMEPTFRRILTNTLVTGVTSSFLWFALTFWVYLQTRSVVIPGVIAGAFSISTALLGPVVGTFVDRHRKRTAMLVATALSAASFGVAAVVFFTVAADTLLRLTNPWF